MKKRTVLLLSILFAAFAADAQRDWALVKGKIATPWAGKSKPFRNAAGVSAPADGAQHLDEPERLMAVRYFAENGGNVPTAYAGNILVPFAVESALSVWAKL
jgi:hypothetical protein